MNQDNVVKALYDYQGTTDEELNFKQGDEFIVLNDENEDWWFVSNRESTVEGYIPSTFVRWINEIPDELNENQGLEEIDEESEVEEEEEEDATTDESLSNQDENDATPDDMIDIIKEQKLAQLRRKSSIRQPLGVKLIVPESNANLDYLPKGFRISTLAKNIENGLFNPNSSLGVGTIEKSLLPELNSGGLSFKDLFLESKRHKVMQKI
jgi:hypothetical protein